MAGLGRRTHYRKHLTDSVLYDLPEPKEDERIAKVVATRGGNQFDIVLAGTDSNDNSSSSSSSRSGLAILPTKFHKLVWVKRNDYVIVQTGIENKQDDDGGGGGDDGNENDPKAEEETGIRFIINHILYKDQVKHLVSKGLWPENDPEFSQSGTVDDKKADDDGIVYNNDHDEYGYDNDDGIVYNEYDDENDDDLFVNTNRIARLEIQDSDSEEDSSDEDDE